MLLEQQVACKPHPAMKLGKVVILTALIFACIELVLQVRTHLRDGQSVFNAFTDETRYVQHPESGLKTLRPNHIFRGSRAEIRTNSLGLRSEPITASEHPAIFRIAVVGASTVMGAYTATNEDTFSYRLAALLNDNARASTFQVINAGIAGYGLDDQRMMIEKVIRPLTPNLIVIYPGFNDFSPYCRAPTPASTETVGQRKGLPRLEAPDWLLAVELVRKNTVSLRTPPKSGTIYKSAHTVDLSPYREKLDMLLTAAKATGADVVISTNTRAFRPDQPTDKQLKLSETMRYYTPCFDVAGLHVLYDRHNQEIAKAAERHGVSLVPLGDAIPGGRDYFVDASHFSTRGEQKVAEQLYRHFIDQGIVPLD